MDRRVRQLLLVADGVRARLPPEVAASAARVMGRLILHRLRVEKGRDPEDADHGKGAADDSRV